MFKCLSTDFLLIIIAVYQPFSNYVRFCPTVVVILYHVSSTLLRGHNLGIRRYQLLDINYSQRPFVLHE